MEEKKIFSQFFVSMHLHPKSENEYISRMVAFVPSDLVPSTMRDILEKKNIFDNRDISQSDNETKLFFKWWLCWVGTEALDDIVGGNLMKEEDPNENEKQIAVKKIDFDRKQEYITFLIDQKDINIPFPKNFLVDRVYFLKYLQ